VSTSVHGHDVIRLIADATKPLKRDHICAEVASRFGENATFHVYAGDGMSVDEILAFLLQRAKIVRHADGTYTADTSLMCDHDG
jgi:probable metal-binding protein